MTEKNNPIVVGLSGNKGSFSEVAAKTYVKNMQLNATLCYLLDMDTVLNQLMQRKIDIGVMPVINSNASIVHQAFKAMGEYEFSLIGSLDLQIEQCLMTLPGVSSDEIKEIVSHPQALAQCKQYLSKHFPAVILTEWIDTAEAAKDLSQAKIAKNAAVIGPKASAELYGLKIVTEGVQDNNPNTTTFIIVKRLHAKLANSGCLESLREEINSIDSKLVWLLSERNQTSLKIGEYKALRKLDVSDKTREQDLINTYKALASDLHLDEQYIERLFKVIFDESKRLQKS